MILLFRSREAMSNLEKFGGGDGRISGKGTIRTSKLDFENVYYVEELQHFNLFSVSQICDKKNKVLFTDTDCLVLSEEFQLPDASQVVLRIPRKHDLYTFHISDLQPEQKVTCLVAKASLDESTRWHRRMAHVNFKTINKLAKGGLVDGLPLKVFTNEHNCVACNKGKQHKASYKHISAVRLITETLQLLHMDLFGPTNIRSIDQKYYSLVVTDDFSRFSWTFFLSTKDETFYVLKEFITLIENQLNKKVKGIRCDNGTEFKNAKLIELCGEKGIKRDYSNPRTPQQNGVAERKNRTLIEAARTMLADSKLPTMFWTEAVSTACYVLNRVSITNPHNKTPYELISGKVPQISHLKPFGCQVTILNTSDYLGKFEGKADEGYLVGYASNSKAYRVYNLPNKRVEETLNLRFLEDKPNVQGIGHEWYFDLDYLTDSLGYTRFKTDTPAGTQETNINAGTQDHDSDSEVDEQVIVVPSFPSNSFAGPSSSNGPSVMERNADYAEELAKLQRQEYEAKDAAARYGYLFSQATTEILCQAEAEIRNQGVSAVKDPAGIDSAVREPAGIVSADGVSTGSPSADSDPAGSNPADCFPPAGSVEPADESNPAVSSSVSADFHPVYADESTLPPGHQLGSSENTTRFPVPSDVCMDPISSGIFTSSSYDDDFRAVLQKRVNTFYLSLRFLVDLAFLPVSGQEAGAQNPKFGESAFIGYIQDQQRTNHTDQLHCLFACFLSQLEPTSIAKALKDRLGNTVKRRALIMMTGYLHSGQIEAIRLFLAFASYMGLSGISAGCLRVPFSMEKFEEEVSVWTYKAPRPDMDRLSAFMLQHNYQKIGVMKGECEMSAIGRDDFLLRSTDETVADGGCHINLLRQMVNFMAGKKQTFGLATSSTEAEYVAAASCCICIGQDLSICLSILDGESSFVICGAGSKYCVGIILPAGHDWCMLVVIWFCAMDYAADSVYLLMGILLLVDSFLLIGLEHVFALCSVDIADWFGLRPNPVTWFLLGEEIPLTPPMLAIAAAGNDPTDDDDAANEDNAAADEAAGSAAEAHPVPHSPLVSPVRELTPERQSAFERPPSLSPTPQLRLLALRSP
ncbi:putative ribonuclease H-like domain-containing protein [Tanacetum coccineum]